MRDAGSDSAGSGSPTRGMTPDEAYAALGLAPAAPPKQIRAAYRRLAFEYHPDRNSNDAESLRRFTRIAAAYATLNRKLDLDEIHDEVGLCSRCGQYAALLAGIDRNLYCYRCLTSIFRPPRLPAPPIIVATCGVTIVMLLIGSVMLGLFWMTRGVAYAAAAFACGAAALVSLAVTAVTIGYTIRRRR